MGSELRAFLDGRRMGTILNLLGRYEPDFFVIEHQPSLQDPARPLVILVHPGDLIQVTDGYDPEPQRKALSAFWRYTGDGTRQELATLRKQGYDFCVLHRSSCAQFARFSKFRVIGRSLWAEIQRGQKRGTVLYGDDLEKASAWMIGNLGIAGRPMVHLAGAYSDPQHGCLTAIGRAIEKVIGGKRMAVSAFSPPENAPGRVWRPDGRTPAMAVPLEVARLYRKLRQQTH